MTPQVQIHALVRVGHGGDEEHVDGAEVAGGHGVDVRLHRADLVVLEVPEQALLEPRRGLAVSVVVLGQFRALGADPEALRSVLPVGANEVGRVHHHPDRVVLVLKHHHLGVVGTEWIPRGHLDGSNVGREIGSVQFGIVLAMDNQ